MGYGQQSDNYDYMNPYLEKKSKATGDYEQQVSKMQDLAAVSNQAANQAGNSTDTQPMISPEFAQGASRGASGGLGSMLMQGGLASTMAGGAAGPYGMAAGLGVMALEGNAQAKQKQAESEQIEAQQRKQAQMAAINNLISVSKGLSV